MRWAVGRLQQSHRAESVIWVWLSEAAGWLWSSNHISNIRILDKSRSEDTSESNCSYVKSIIPQGWASTVSVWCIPSSKGWVDMQHYSCGILALAFTDQSCIDSETSWGWVGWAPGAPYSVLSKWCHFVCADSNRLKVFMEEEKMLLMKQNDLFIGNAKWVYIIQWRVWSGIIC
jgi:hypothetical protein